MQGAVDILRELGDPVRDDGRLRAPIARARDAPRARGARPRRQGLRRRRRRRRAPGRRRRRAHDPARHRRADRFVRAERARRAAVDRADAARRARSRRCRSASPARPTPACSRRRSSRSATRRLPSRLDALQEDARREGRGGGREAANSDSARIPDPGSRIPDPGPDRNEVLHRHLRLSREPGGLAAHRGGASRARRCRRSRPSDADLVVVNTCSVTATADQGARQTIRRIARDNPRVRVVVTGCYATRCEGDVAALPNVVRVVRNDEKDTSGRRRARRSLVFRPGRTHRTATVPAAPPIEPGIAGRTAFTLRVQTGCEETCAYCIIPTTRGAGRSLPIDDVVREVRADRGVRIQGDRAHRRAPRLVRPRPRAAALARRAAAGARRLVRRTSSFASARSSRWTARRRSSTSWPRAAAASRRTFTCRCSTPAIGCWRDAAAVHARTTTARSSTGFAARLPHASIGSDMIVGLSRRDATTTSRRTSTTCRASPLTHLHVFPYSDRPGTEATAMRGKVDGIAIRERGPRAAGDRRGARAPVPRVAGRHDSSGPHARGRHARRDGQLSEGEDSAGRAAERAGERQLSAVGYGRPASWSPDSSLVRFAIPGFGIQLDYVPINIASRAPGAVARRFRDQLSAGGADVAAAALAHRHRDAVVREDRARSGSRDRRTAARTGSPPPRSAAAG